MPRRPLQYVNHLKHSCYAHSNWLTMLSNEIRDCTTKGEGDTDYKMDNATTPIVTASVGGLYTYVTYTPGRFFCQGAGQFVSHHGITVSLFFILSHFNIRKSPGRFIFLGLLQYHKTCGIHNTFHFWRHLDSF